MNTIQGLLKGLIDDLRTLDWRSLRSRAAFRSALAVTLSLFIGYFFNFDSPHWIGISAFLVCQASSGATVRKALQRILGTLCAFAIIMGLIAWFENQPFVMFCIYMILSSFYVYYIIKSGDYFWMASMITVTLIMGYAASGPSPDALMTFALDRVIETSMGSILAVVVMLLMPDYAFETVVKSNQDMFAYLKSLMLLTASQYRCNDALYVQFEDLRHPSQLLLAQQPDLRSQCAYEKKGYSQPLALNQQLERVTLSVLDLVGAEVKRYDHRMDLLKDQVNLEQLFAIENELLNGLQAYLSGDLSVETDCIESMLANAQQAFNEVTNQLSQARDGGSLTQYGFDVRLTIEHYVLMHQKFILMLRGLYFENQKKQSQGQVKPANFAKVQMALFGYEPFYWAFAFKCAFVIVVFTALSMYINLGTSAGWIIAVLAAKLFIDVRSYIGFFIGYIFGLILAFLTAIFSLESFAFALFLCAIVTYCLAYLNTVRSPFVMAFSVAVWISFIYTVFTGSGPIDVQGFTGALEGYYAMIFFMGGLYLLNLYLPAKKEQLLALYRRRILSKREEIDALLVQYRHLSIDMIDERLALASRVRQCLNAIRAELDKIADDNLGCEGEAYNVIECYLDAEWHSYYALANVFLCYRTICFAPTIFDDVRLQDAIAIIKSEEPSQSKYVQLDMLTEQERLRLNELKSKGEPISYSSVLYGFNIFTAFADVCRTDVLTNQEYDDACNALRASRS